MRCARVTLVRPGRARSEGHCLRLDVSSSSFPHFDVNLNTGGDLCGRVAVTAINTVHHSARFSSHLVLPVTVRVCVCVALVGPLRRMLALRRRGPSSSTARPRWTRGSCRSWTWCTRRRPPSPPSTRWARRWSRDARQRHPVQQNGLAVLRSGAKSERRFSRTQQQRPGRGRSRRRLAARGGSRSGRCRRRWAPSAAAPSCRTACRPRSHRRSSRGPCRPSSRRCRVSPTGALRAARALTGNRW